MSFNKKEYQQNYFKKWYAENKKEHINKIVKNNKLRRKKTRDIIREYKKQRGCKYCNEHDPVSLDFHHRKNKQFNISDMVKHGCSLKKIMIEIEKCDIHCANCHRKITFKQGVGAIG